MVKRALDIAANVLIVALTVLVAGAYYRRWKGGPDLESPAIRLPDSPRIGDRLQPVVGKPLGRRGGVVLVTASTCAASKSSMGLYRELSDRIHEDDDWRFIVIGDSRDDLLNNWLQQQQVRANDVVQTNLSMAGFWATPLLFVVDGTGTITDVGTGQLTAPEETLLWDRLDGMEGVHLNAFIAPPWTAKQTTASPQIVDVRSRDKAVVKPIKQALNIPADEVNARARFELAHDRPVLIDCYELPAACYSAAQSMHEDGYDVMIRLQPITQFN